MPGPKKQYPIGTPAQGGLMRPLNDGTAPAECPDPAPYQRKRSETFPSLNGPVVVETNVWTIAGLRKWLAACPTDVVTIQPTPGTDPDDETQMRPHQVVYDGYFFWIPKGVPYVVPVPIAEIVKQSQQRHRTAQSRGVDLMSLTISARNPDGMEIDAGAIGLDGGFGPAPTEYAEE